MIARDETAMNDALIDASSAILLFKAGLIAASCHAFHLLMTRSVFEEVAVPEQPGAEDLRELTGRQPGISLLPDPAGALAGSITTDIDRLHRGERDTLAHYLRGAARFVIIDDGRGVQVCRRHAIPHVNALLLPKLLFFADRLSAQQAHRYFTRIQSLGRYSGTVVARADAFKKGDLAYFLSAGDRRDNRSIVVFADEC
jgi:hypothetical protein